MVDRGGATQRFAGVLAGVALILAVTGCRAALQSTASPSTALASSLAPITSPSESIPTLAASPNGTPLPTLDPRSDSFAILPGTQPADYDLSGMSCSGPIGAHDPVAVVQLHVAAGQPPHAVLRDYADVAHPRTVCELGAYGFDLIDARHGLIPGPAGAIVDLPELRFHWFALPATPGNAPGLIAISPALDQIVWSTTDPEGTATDTIHLTTATGDRVLATLRDTNTGRCSSPDDSRPGGFTPSGKHAYVLNQPLQQQASLLVVEAGKVVFSVLPPAGKDWPENAWPAMAVWSPTAETLYYRQGTDIWKWSSGSGAQKFLPGVRWFYPTISPDGRWLAYAVEIPNFLHAVYVVDLAHGGTPQKIGPGAHNYPVFLNDSQLWLMAESLYTGCADNSELKPMVYNVVSRTEAPSIIDWVDSAWPATSSNW